MGRPRILHTSCLLYLGTWDYLVSEILQALWPGVAVSHSGIVFGVSVLSSCSGLSQTVAESSRWQVQQRESLGGDNGPEPLTHFSSGSLKLPKAL